MPPTMPSTFSVSISFLAQRGDLGRVGLLGLELVLDRAAVDAAVVVDAVEVRLRPCVAISVKSVPGCLVAIAPILIGAPVAFCPFLPHFVTSPAAFAVVVLPPPPAARRASCRRCCCRRRQRAPTGRPRVRAAQRMSPPPSQPKIVLTCDPPPPPTDGAEPSVRQAHSCTENEPTRSTRAQSRRLCRLFGGVCTGLARPSCSPPTYALTHSEAEGSLGCGAPSA